MLREQAQKNKVNTFLSSDLFFRVLYHSEVFPKFLSEALFRASLEASFKGVSLKT